MVDVGTHLAKAGEEILKVLVRAHDDPKDAWVRDFGMYDVDLALKADYDPKAPDFLTAVDELQARGLIALPGRINDHRYLCPSPAGLDYARWLLRPWWQKVLDKSVRIPSVIYWIIAVLAAMTAIAKAFGIV